jgi:D-xylose transport system substrate-binding protein
MKLRHTKRPTGAGSVRRRVAAAAALTMVVSGALAACGSDGGSGNSGNNGKLKIGIIFVQDMVSRWKFDQQGFVDQVKALGAEPIVASAQSDPQKQRNLVESMITQQVDALVITPVDVTTAGELFKMAKDADIPTVDYNFVVPDSGADYLVARDAREFGRLVAEKAVKERPEGNYVIVSGDEATSVARDTQEGLLEGLKPQLDSGKVKIASQQYNTGWDPQKALGQAEQALVKTDNDVAAFLVGNDGMAGGVMQALQKESLLGKAFVSGIDADLPAVQAIAKGEQTVTVWTDFTKMGKAAADLAVAAAKGEKPDVPNLTAGTDGEPGTVNMETILVDKPGLCEWLQQYKYYTVEQVYGDDAASCQA